MRLASATMTSGTCKRLSSASKLLTLRLQFFDFVLSALLSQSKESEPDSAAVSGCKSRCSSKSWSLATKSSFSEHFMHRFERKEATFSDISFNRSSCSMLSEFLPDKALLRRDSLALANRSLACKALTCFSATSLSFVCFFSWSKSLSRILITFSDGFNLAWVSCKSCFTRSLLTTWATTCFSTSFSSNFALSSFKSFSRNLAAFWE
mmetsp:Transcript_45536/g.110307  ORF Transcript_45536/g.110307 Transcript_45536/m.110307 type:complete len:207 (-) Transcript_45536:2127-2747(-)